MESISDDYDHLQSDLEYVVENVLQTTNTRTDSFERLADEFNSFIENKCSCSTLSKCKDDNCCHGNSYIRNDELVLNSNRRSKDLIYECSAHCSCTQKCENRLVQFGLRKHLRIVPCDRKRLGLITLAAIAEGAFICEYAGEVLTKNEAVRRQRRNDESGEMNYIICLIERPTAADENAKICTFIDPSRLGNIGRYLNHSCDPNCEILSVRIDGPIPKLAIFSRRYIEASEELCFDYGGDRTTDEPNASSGSPKRKPCFCGSSNCRGFLPNFQID